MPTPAERKALVFFAGLLLLGSAVRTHRALRDNPEPDAESRRALRRQLAAVDSVRANPPAPRASGASSTRARPRRQGGSRADTAAGARSGAVPDLVRPTRTVDLDVASAAEIERLPRIGPVLAARIVANRDSLGPFGSLQEFQRVRGVGPAMAKTLAPHVTFSLAPRQSVVIAGGSGAPTTARSPRRRSRAAHPP